MSVLILYDYRTIVIVSSLVVDELLTLRVNEE